MPTVHFYFDWKFWSAVIAFAALILSQLPPLYLLVRKPKLEAEAFTHITLFHKVGNPNAALHLVLTNSGGRAIRIKRLSLVFTQGKNNNFTLPALAYYLNPTDKDSVILTPFKLKPNEEWAHVVQFFEPFSREEDKRYRGLESALRQDINAKLAALPQTRNRAAGPVAADDVHVRPLLDFFETKFRWPAGEYNLKLQIETDPPKASFRKQYRLTLFESDCKELTDHRDDYKYGFGVYLNSVRTPLAVPLMEA